MAKKKKKKTKLAEGYYDPRDYVLVHKKYLAKLKAALEKPKDAEVVAVGLEGVLNILKDQS